MRLRTPLLLLTGALAGSIVPSTAFAAVPKTKPKSTIVCPGQPDKSARVWTRLTKGSLTKLAIDNPCSSYLAYGWGSYASGFPREELLVPPGVHFHWSKSRIQAAEVRPGSTHWHEQPECSGPTTVRVVLRYDKVQSTEEAYGLIC